MFCEVCGTKREDGEIFCGLCGTVFNISRGGDVYNGENRSANSAASNSAYDDVSSNINNGADNRTRSNSRNNMVNNTRYNQTPGNPRQRMQNTTRPGSRRVSRRQHNIRRVMAITGILSVVLIVVFIVSLSGGDSNREENISEGLVSDRASETVTRQRRNTTTYINGRGFSDGVAWVLSDEDIWHCVDMAGNIVLRLNNSETPASDFSLSVALVRRADNILELIDKKGNIISSPKSEEYDRIVDFLPDLGMIKVHKRVVTFEVTENRAGIIDNQGLWQTPLTNDYALVNGRYVGEGIFTNWSAFTPGTIFDLSSSVGAPGLVGIGNDGENGYFINILSNTAFVLSGLTYGTSSDEFNNGRIKNMDNGYGILRAWSSYYYAGETRTGGEITYSINCDGQLNELFSSDSGSGRNGPLLHYSEGLFYRPWFEKRGFYDINGRLVIDLSDLITIATNREYIESQEPPYFQDEYCLLVLLNPQGSRFFTIIDKTGNQMFEPRPIGNRESRDLKLNSGLVVINKGNNTYTIINTAGEPVVEISDVSSVSNYSDGFAMVTTNDGIIYYINRSGERLF